MKKRASHCLKLLFLAAAVALSSCTTEEYYNEYYSGTEMKTETFTVLAHSWIWNPDYSRWEYVFEYPEITPYVYNSGAVQAGVYVEEYGGEYETLKSLPFIETLGYQGGMVTKTMGFDISVGSIAFTIQMSDMNRHDGAIGTHKFKVSVIRDYPAN